MPPSCGQPRRPGPAAQQDTERPTRGFTGLTAPPGACRQVRTLTGAERRQAPGALTSDPAFQGPAERAGPPVRLRAPLSTAHREGGGNPTRPCRGGSSPSVYGASYHAVHQAPRQRGVTDVLDDLLQVFQPSPAPQGSYPNPGWPLPGHVMTSPAPQGSYPNPGWPLPGHVMTNPATGPGTRIWKDAGLDWYDW